MDFAWAINALKQGQKVTRNGWNGKSQYIELATCVSYKNTQGEIVNVNHDTMGNKAIAFVGTSGVQLGWLASQSDMLSDDWVIYFGEGHEKLTPEEAVAYKKQMIAHMQRHAIDSDCGPLAMSLMSERELSKLPKLGSMENCEKLSNAINHLLESIGVMPHLTVTLVPGPEDKELTIAIREKSENGEANYPIHVDGDMQIIHHEVVACHVINPDGITKSSIGSDALNDNVEG